MAIIDRTKIQMAAPEYGTDQVIGIVSGTVAIALGGPGGAQTFASDSKQTGFADTCLPRGIYSIDGGTSWVDLGDSILNGDDATAGQLYLNSGISTYTDGTVVPNWGNTTKSAYTAQYKVALLAKTDQGNITPIATSPILSYTTKYNYMKIAFASKVTVAPSGTTTITHGFGYVPNFLVWRTTDQTVFGDNLGLTVLGGRGGATITNSALTLTNNDSTNSRTFHYRIYLDA